MLVVCIVIGMFNKMIVLTILVPVYNEEKTLQELLLRIEQQQFHSVSVEKEVLVIDDASTDQSAHIARAFCATREQFRFHALPGPNGGKGRALQWGYAQGRGEVFLVQDADLEYDTGDYEKLILPIVRGETQFVMGVRFSEQCQSYWRLRHGMREKSYALLLNYSGQLLNMLVNVLYRGSLLDHSTMFKVYHRDLLSRIRLDNVGFDLELEMVCKCLRNKIHPVQIPVRYHARSQSEGKKIRFFSDGIKFIRAVIKYRLMPLSRL